MEIGVISIDGCIPIYVKEEWFIGENELFIIENRALEMALVPYALQHNTAITVLPCMGAFSEKTFYTAQIDVFKKRCDAFICFANEDSKQLQWCLDYAQQLKLDAIVCWV